jgi:hypothetical protein
MRTINAFTFSLMLIIASHASATAITPAEIFLTVINKPYLADGTTNITDKLNTQITPNADERVYTGGLGLVVRGLNDNFTVGTKTPSGGTVQVQPAVVPGSFIVNDIFAPNLVFNAAFSNLGLTGFVAIYDEQTAFLKLFDGNVQGSARDGPSQYNLGVFYAGDSNSTDQRCRWMPSGSVWNCRGMKPGDGTYAPDNSRGYIENNGSTFTQNNSAAGTGAFPMGNPWELPNGGGGTGPHFSWDGQNAPFLNQDNARDANGNGLSQNNATECNSKYFVDKLVCDEYSYSGLQGGQSNCWDNWVNHWVMYTENPTLVPQAIKNPNFGPYQRDFAMCYNYNLRDMINLQNSLWLQRLQWTLFTEATEYPGYNEIPIDANYAKDPQNIQAFAIVLPVGAGEPTALSSGAKSDLDGNLLWYIDNGFLVPGVDNVGRRPGSYVVFVRQNEDGNGNFSQEFFCANLETNHHKVVYVPKSGANPTGACYLEY